MNDVQKVVFRMCKMIVELLKQPIVSQIITCLFHLK